MANTTELTGFKKYCKEQNIEFSVNRIFIDGRAAWPTVCSLLC